MAEAQTSEGQVEEPPATAPAAAAAAEPTGNLASTAETPPATPAAVEPTWPGDWRDAMASGDEKLRQRLDRFTDPAALGKAYQEAQAKISQLGQNQGNQGPPEDASEEDVKTWREANGIPEAPDGYEISLLDGYELTPEDEPVLNSFKEAAHAGNLPPDVVNLAANWYANMAAEQRAAQVEADRVAEQQSADELRAAWGDEFRGNLNAAASVLGDLGGEVVEARMPDGRLLGNHPGFLSLMADLARQVNPIAGLMPAGQSSATGVDQEITSIEKTMRDNPREYWKDQAMQDRYGQLLAFREAQKG